MVYFFEEKHEYFNIYNQKYKSVSGLMYEYISSFDDIFSSEISAFREFDEELYKLAKKKYKWYDKEILKYLTSLVSTEEYDKIKEKANELRSEWLSYSEERSIYGTDKHSLYEKEDELQGYKVNPIDKLKYKVIGRVSSLSYDNCYLLNEILKLKENVCLLEGLLVDHDSMTCGQEDVIFLKYMGNNKFCAYNLDYKTDKQINTKSFFMGNGNRKLNGILNAFQDCNFYIYSLKQSLYALMLEKEGVKVIGNYLMHVPEGGETKYIKTPYYRKHAEMMIKKNK